MKALTLDQLAAKKGRRYFFDPFLEDGSDAHHVCTSTTDVSFADEDAARAFLEQLPDAGVESTHAQEHWLRMAADRAIKIAAPSAPWGGDTVLVDLISNASGYAASAQLQDNAEMLRRIEFATAYLLRAAVILRREETRR